MKKLAAILLMGILLFNWLGYRVLISFLESKADMQLEAEFDENKYDESQLISIKVPVRYLPYYNSSSTFERVDGQIEIKGIQYKYVKKRIFNDSLEMLCIPNHASIKLQTAKNEFFKFSNDLQQDKNPGPHPGPLKIFSLDYYTATDLFRVSKPHFTVSRISSPYFFFKTLSYTYIVEQPPDIC